MNTDERKILKEALKAYITELKIDTRLLNILRSTRENLKMAERGRIIARAWLRRNMPRVDPDLVVTYAGRYFSRLVKRYGEHAPRELERLMRRKFIQNVSWLEKKYEKYNAEDDAATSERDFMVKPGP